MRKTLRTALVETATAWRDPDYPPRAEAVARTLEAANRFTPEALAFAINQQMHVLTPEALHAWPGPDPAAQPCRVGVLPAEGGPLDGLWDMLAVVLAGHRYQGRLPEASPALLPAFADDVRRHVPVLPVAFFEEAVAVLDASDALLATLPADEHAALAAACAQHGIPERCRLLRPTRYGIAVLDGHETDDDYEGLAEDILLHEGLAETSVALLWAPATLSPDALLDSFAYFRGVFPAHPSTAGALTMQQAFLAATNQPHAYGDGLEFLMSRGDAVVQPPGHLRWIPYETLGAVETWINHHVGELAVVVAREALAARLPGEAPRVSPGHAHRPPLGGFRPAETLDFLAALGC